MVFSQNGKLASQYFKQNNVSSVDYSCLDFYSQTVINNKYLYFIMVQPSRISPIDLSVTKPRLQKKKQNSLDPICKMVTSIHYCYSIRGTWPRWRQHDKGLWLMSVST